MIVDSHSHIVVRPATVDGGAVGADRPRLVRADDHWTIEHEGRVLSSAVAEMVEPEVMSAQAKAQGVDHLLLSPWVRLLPFDLPVDEAWERARVQNAALAEIVAAAPDRFSAVGCLPLQDPAAAADALPALRRDGLAGVELTAAVAGRFLGDDAFEPFWAAAEQTGSLVFVHPSTRGLAMPVFEQYYLWNSVANPVETAVTAAQMVMAGVLERHPGLRVLLAHGGGAVGAVRGRLRRSHAVQPTARARLAGDPVEMLARFYYDTVTHDPVLLARLVADVGAGQVLLGSDRPFDMGSPDPVGEVRAAGLSPADEAAVLGGNAERLLGLARPA